ncbi:MAG: hypothetical protein RIR09_56, partial [Pseudomonadota bacterium]
NDRKAHGFSNEPDAPEASDAEGAAPSESDAS